MSASAKFRMVYPSGADSPGKSRTKGRKTVVVVVVVLLINGAEKGWQRGDACRAALCKFAGTAFKTQHSKIQPGSKAYLGFIRMDVSKVCDKYDLIKHRKVLILCQMHTHLVCVVIAN